MADPMRLDGRCVMVTGAGQGIGRAIAERALALGASVALVDLNGSGLAEIERAHGSDRVLTIAGSVADEAFVDEAMARTLGRFGALDGLVNNAGIVRAAMIEKMTLEQWQLVIDVNLTGVFLCLRAAGRVFLDQVRSGKRDGASIVNISSDAGRKGTIGQINYGAAKAGVIGITMSAAREWARFGIRVNSTCYGVVETEMTETVRSDKFRDRYLASIPTGRFLSPAEAAHSVCFLLSDAAVQITGQQLSVNGGSFVSA